MQNILHVKKEDTRVQDCGADPTCVMCVACFKRSPCVGHNFRLVRRWVDLTCFDPCAANKSLFSSSAICSVLTSSWRVPALVRGRVVPCPCTWRCQASWFAAAVDGRMRASIPLHHSSKSHQVTNAAVKLEFPTTWPHYRIYGNGAQRSKWTPAKSKHVQTNAHVLLIHVFCLYITKYSFVVPIYYKHISMNARMHVECLHLKHTYSLDMHAF
jgi:hypothetical protein